MGLSATDRLPLLAIATGATLGAIVFGRMTHDAVPHYEHGVRHEVTIESAGPVGEARVLAIRSAGPVEDEISGAREPLVYVDGVRLSDRSAIADIDPDGIDRIEVLKGGAAITVYGPEAVGGVIQIYLKTGEKGSR